MDKRFVVELLFNMENEDFEVDRQYEDFEQARLHCALQVCMNPRVIEGRVRDREAHHFPFPYSAEDAGWAMLHLHDWGHSWPFKGLCSSCREALDREGHLPRSCEICGRD